jgi:hypothetical protein
VVSIREEEKTREDFTTHDYLIYFIERPDRNWWDYVFRTRPGFRHCFATQWCEWSKRWIMVDWRQSKTDFTVFFDFEIESIIRHIGEWQGTVVKFKAVEPPNDSGALITYCSNILSRYLGLGNRLILTPYGLYRRLLATGGEVVFSWSDENEQQAQADKTAEGTRTTLD